MQLCQRVAVKVQLDSCVVYDDILHQLVVCAAVLLLSSYKEFIVILGHPCSVGQLAFPHSIHLWSVGYVWVIWRGSVAFCTCFIPGVHLLLFILKLLNLLIDGLLQITLCMHMYHFFWMTRALCMYCKQRGVQDFLIKLNTL